MSTFKEKSCVGITAPAFIRDKKSKTIELLKLRQCRDTCCPRIFTEKWVEELVDRGFATTSEDRTSTSKEASLGMFPIRTDISGVAAAEFTVTLETARRPLIPTVDPSNDEVTFEYEVNGGATTVANVKLELGPLSILKDTKAETGLSTGDVITHRTKLSLTTAKVGTLLSLDEGTFTLP